MATTYKKKKKKLSWQLAQTKSLRNFILYAVTILILLLPTDIDEVWKVGQGDIMLYLCPDCIVKAATERRF